MRKLGVLIAILGLGLNALGHSVGIMAIIGDDTFTALTASLDLFGSHMVIGANWENEVYLLGLGFIRPLKIDPESAYEFDAGVSLYIVVPDFSAFAPIYVEFTDGTFDYQIGMSLGLQGWGVGTYGAIGLRF